MSLLDLFRSRRDAVGHAGDTETVRRVVRELDQLEPTRARFLAAFADWVRRFVPAE